MLYEYICLNCGELIEIKATIEEKEKGLKVVCQKCGSDKVQRIYSSFVVRTKDSKGNPPTCSCCGG